MGVPAKGGGGFGCLWCRTPLTDERMLKDADRQIRRMAGQKSNGTITELTLDYQLGD